MIKEDKKLQKVKKMCKNLLLTADTIRCPFTQPLEKWEALQLNIFRTNSLGWENILLWLLVIPTDFSLVVACAKIYYPNFL